MCCCCFIFIFQTLRCVHAFYHFLQAAAATAAAQSHYNTKCNNQLSCDLFHALCFCLHCHASAARLRVIILLFISLPFFSLLMNCDYGIMFQSICMRCNISCKTIRCTHECRVCTVCILAAAFCLFLAHTESIISWCFGKIVFAFNAQ